MTTYRRRATAAIVPILLLALPMATQAAGTLDQQSTSFGDARGLIGTYDNGQDVIHAQTFRAGVSGLLDQVDLPVRVVGDPGVSLTVEIRALDGAGMPAAVLGSAVVSQASLPACNTPACDPVGDFTTFSFTSVPLTTPASVTSLTDYAIVLSATNARLDIYGTILGRTVNRYEWAATTNQLAYGNGDGLSYVGGVGWGPSNVDKAFKTYVVPSYSASVRQPINADGSSNFKAGRGVVPVKFGLSAGGSPTCALPAATIALTKTAGADSGPINESTYLLASDNGSSFRISDCQYIYNLNVKTLGPGTYLVEILIDGRTVGSATFDLR